MQRRGNVSLSPCLSMWRGGVSWEICQICKLWYWQKKMSRWRRGGREEVRDEEMFDGVFTAVKQMRYFREGEGWGIVTREKWPRNKYIDLPCSALLCLTVHYCSLLCVTLHYSVLWESILHVALCGSGPTMVTAILYVAYTTYVDYISLLCLTVRYCSLLCVTLHYSVFCESI